MTDDRSTALERAARAMCVAQRVDPDADFRVCDGVVLAVAVEHPENWRLRARWIAAALRALRVPDEAMLRSMMLDSLPGQMVGPHIAKAVWQAAIDQILEGK